MPDANKVLHDLVRELDELTSSIEKAVTRVGEKSWDYRGWDSDDVRELDRIFRKAWSLSENIEEDGEESTLDSELHTLEESGERGYALPPRFIDYAVLPIEEAEQCDITADALREVLVRCVSDEKLRKKLEAGPPAHLSDSEPTDPATDWRWEGRPDRIDRLVKILRGKRKMAAGDIERKLNYPPSKLLRELRKTPKWKKWVEHFIGHEHGMYWFRGK